MCIVKIFNLMFGDATFWLYTTKTLYGICKFIEFIMRRILITILLSSTLLSQIKVGDDAPTFFVRDLTEQNFFFSDTLKLGKPTVKLKLLPPLFFEPTP